MNADEAQQLRILSRRITAALVVVAVVAMVFTAVSVTTFALDHGVSPWVAWTLDPMVAVALLAVLLADARLVELGVAPSGWATALRWFAGMATWAMNAWQSVWPDGRFGVPRDVDAAGVVLHSVAPVLLVLLAEAATGYRRVIAARIRHLEGVHDGGRPHLEVVDDGRVSGSGHVGDHLRGAAEMVAIEDAPSSWDEPWRAPWGNELPEASRHREASVAGPFGGLADDRSTARSGDHSQPRQDAAPVVAPVVADRSAVVVQTVTTDDHLDDQAHDHPGTFWDPGKMVAEVVAGEIFGDYRSDQDTTTSTTTDAVADPVTCVAQKATQVHQGWASVPTLDEVVTDDRKNLRGAEVFRGSPENEPPATVVQTGTVAGDRVDPATVDEGYAPVHTPAPSSGQDAGTGKISDADEGSGAVPTQAAKGTQMSGTPGSDQVGQFNPPLSDADLRKAAKRLQRAAVRDSGRPVTVDVLRTELGLSRRRAAELRREVVGAGS